MSEDAALRYAEEFARLSHDLHQGDRLTTMERIVKAAVELVEPCDWCTATVWHPDGKIETAAGTSSDAAVADELQYALGEGPCLDAIWRTGIFVIENLADERRWPNWAPQAAALGIGSVLSVRIDMAGPGPGAALNLYSTTADSFDHGDVAIASILARHASSALEGARQQDQLRSAAQSRLVIGVAEGILMQRFGLSLDQSFELLRRYSQTHNVKLRVLAENLVASGGIPEHGDSDTETALRRSFGVEPGPTHASSESSDETGRV
jgi:GAF domain-containing protein